jgi:hypothetical protein
MPLGLYLTINFPRKGTRSLHKTQIFPRKGTRSLHKNTNFLQKIFLQLGKTWNLIPRCQEKHILAQFRVCPFSETPRSINSGSAPVNTGLHSAPHSAVERSRGVSNVRNADHTVYLAPVLNFAFLPNVLLCTHTRPPTLVGKASILCVYSLHRLLHTDIIPFRVVTILFHRSQGNLNNVFVTLH